MNKTVNILCIEDNEFDYKLITRILEQSEFSIANRRIQSENEFKRTLESDRPDVIICDHTLPGFDSFAALQILKENDKDIPFIIVSGTIGEEAAVDAMLRGADDYILKDNLKRLLVAVEREIKESKQRRIQRKSRKKLVISELKFSFLAESIQEVFFAFDKDLTLTYWNRTATSIFKLDNLYGRNITEVFPTWCSNGVIKQIKEALVSNTCVALSFSHQLEREEFFNGSIYPAGNGGTVLLRKITDEKQQEDQMVKLNNELETLLYRISHDLKGPVASVMGLLNLLEKDPEFDLKKFIYMMDINMKRLDQTLVRLLNITKLKAGTENAERLNVYSALQEVIQSLIFLDGFENVSIKMDLSLDLEIYCARSIFDCIWQNLLENTIKYQDKGQVNYVTIQATENKKGVNFSITDTGQGVDPSIQVAIFDMFFRGNEHSDGSGLGLYIVKNALSKVNGNISIDPSYSKGARFYIRIPQFVKSKTNENEKQLYDYKR